MSKRRNIDDQIKLERERFADFQRATSEWSWETDKEDRFTYMSANVFEMTGIEPEWHYGKSREDLGLREEIGEAAWREFQGIHNRREPFTNFTYARRGPVATTWLQVSGVPFYVDGEYCGYRGSARMVTKEIETAELAKQLTAALENMGDYFSLWDENDRLIFTNNKFLELNAHTPEASRLGIEFAEHIRLLYGYPSDSYDTKRVEATIADRIKHHREPGAPFEYRRSDGVVVLINEHKLPDGLTATIATDISRLRAAERDSAEKAEIVETAFRTIPDGILVLGANGSPVTWNDQLFTIFNLRELKNTNVEELRVALLSLILQKVATSPAGEDDIDVSALILNPSKPVQHEFRLADDKWVEFRGSPMSGGGYIMSFRDFTERYHLDRMKGEFVSTVSHELRTPLTSILGSLGLVRGGAGGVIPDAAQDLVEIGIENGERLLNLINDILDLDKINRNDFILDLETLSINDLVDASVKANLGFADRFDIQLRVLKGEHDYIVNGDRQRLMQVMDNLLSNAVKFSSREDVVEIQLSERRGFVRVAITDQGPGVPRKFKKTIFDRFVQVDSSDTRSIAGTGLGLSICKGIISGHAGIINLYSTPSMGSTFYFELPIVT